MLRVTTRLLHLNRSMFPVHQIPFGDSKLAFYSLRYRVIDAMASLVVDIWNKLMCLHGQFKELI